MTTELMDGGNVQLQSGVAVNSGEGGPVFERFAPARTQTTPFNQDGAATSVEAENARYASMMSPELIKQYEALPEATQAPARRPLSLKTVKEEQPEEPKLPENQVLLKDGRVVTIMETSPRHDSAVERVLGQSGLTLTGLGAMGYQRAMALCALESVGRLNRQTGEIEDVEPLMVPRTKLLWEERLDYIYLTSDALKIVAAYNRLNGNETE